MKPARILLIVVAIVAGGLAAFLATRGNNPRPQETESAALEVQTESRAQVLVATRAIGLGQRLTEADVGWQDWPEGGVRSEFITAGAVPDAPQQVTGSVARFEFFAGEPIREAKLVNSTQGYLSAVIGQGMRAVSVSVNPDSASGGYIVPNDRVDVVLTPSGGDYSETILSNVRVLAIGTRLGEVGTTGGQVDPDNPSSQVFEKAEIATLELTPAQSETILQSGSVGRLALVLRSVVDFGQTAADDHGGSQTVRLVRYGQSQSVTSSAQRTTPSSGTSVSALDNPADPTVPAQPLSPVIEVR
jgi:pilus assembly protein CpaB